MEESCCYLHPDFTAALRCVACDRPICDTCRVKKDERGICYPCYAVEERPGEAPPPELDLPTVPLIGGPDRPGLAGAPKRVLRAVVVGGTAALFIAFLWGKLVFFLRYDTLYFALFAVLGVAISVSMAGSYRRSIPRGVIGGACCALCILLHLVFLGYDQLVADRETARALKQVSWADLVVPLFRAVALSMDPRDWGILLVGTAMGGFVSGAGGVEQAMAPPPVENTASTSEA